MKSKVFLLNKSKHGSGLCKETEEKIDEYLNDGYKIVSSQIIFEGLFAYTYTVMVKE